MRPCFLEMINGVFHTWENVITPFVAKSGEGELMRQMKGGSTVLKLLAAQYESEGEKLFNGNKALREALDESIPVFRNAGMGDLADRVQAVISKAYIPKDAYPATRLLIRESNDLNAILEIVLERIAAFHKKDPAMEKVRGRFLDLMKQRMEQDMDMDRIIRGDDSELKRKISAFMLCINAGREDISYKTSYKLSQKKDRAH